MKMKRRYEFDSLKKRYLSNNRSRSRALVKHKIKKLPKHVSRPKISRRQKRRRTRRLRLARKKASKILKKENERKNRLNKKILKQREFSNKPTRVEKRLLKKNKKLIKKVEKIKYRRLLKQKHEEAKLLGDNEIAPKKKIKRKRRRNKVKLFKKSKLHKKRKYTPVTKTVVSKVKKKEIEDNLKTLNEQYRFGKMSRRSYDAIRKNLQYDLEKI